MDKDTFWKHINPLQEKLFRFSLSILKSREEAQDALHDVLEKLWHKRRQLSKERNIDSFAMKVMKNHCIDVLRKKGRMLYVDEKASTNVVFQKYEQQDMIEFIKKRMELLPLQQKMIVELKDFQGFNYSEISDIMDIPITTLRVNLSRARKYLLKPIDHEIRKI